MEAAQRTARQKELRAIMQEHRLTYKDVAELADVSVKAVEKWLASPDSKARAAIRRPYLELIKLRLERRKEKS